MSSEITEICYVYGTLIEIFHFPQLGTACSRTVSPTAVICATRN